METHGKRARELAQQERRERKRAKKAEAAAIRSGKIPADEGGLELDSEGQAPTATAEELR
jgi:hypothetical protein